MRAIVIRQYGGPEQLQIEELPTPTAAPGMAVIQVKAFGLNRAETYMRQGSWGEVAPVSGIECVGLIEDDPSGRFQPGQTVAALMGGMGRSINGSYAEYTRVPLSNILPLATTLPWAELAALPESYATAWRCLFGNLDLQAGQTLLVRGATSALGQAAVNIACHHGVTVLASTRKPERAAQLGALGASEVLPEAADLSRALRRHWPAGVDAVLDIVGNNTLLDSLHAVRFNGKVCQAGFLGGMEPVKDFTPLAHLPSGVQLSFFASFMFGQPDFSLADIPLQTIVRHTEAGHYQAKPARVFRFEEMPAAHRLIESDGANGKVVVVV